MRWLNTIPMSKEKPILLSQGQRDPPPTILADVAEACQMIGQVPSGAPLQNTPNMNGAQINYGPQCPNDDIRSQRGRIWGMGWTHHDDVNLQKLDLARRLRQHNLRGPVSTRLVARMVTIRHLPQDHNLRLVLAVGEHLEDRVLPSGDVREESLAEGKDGCSFPVRPGQSLDMLTHKGGRFHSPSLPSAFFEASWYTPFSESNRSAKAFSLASISLAELAELDSS